MHTLHFLVLYEYNYDQLCLSIRLQFDVCQFVWVGPVFIVIATYFLYTEIGPSAFLAMGMVVGLIPLQIVLSRLFTRLRLS